MILQLYIYNELRGEMTFPNFKVVGYAEKEAFKKRKNLLDDRIDLLKKTFLRGVRSMQPYEIILVHESRINWPNRKFEPKVKKVKDYAPEGKSTYCNKTARSFSSL